LALDIAWLGLAYGIIDALFLNVMPVLAIWTGFSQVGWAGSWLGKIGVGVLALFASLLVTFTYHVGYSELRNKSVGLVLVGAVYIGKWRKEAVKFLQANERLLAERQVWLFSSGPTGEGDPLALTQGWRFPGKLQPIADRIRPRDIAVFHGALDMNKLNFIEKWMIKNVKAPVGDFRDWDTITSWATDIAALLNEAGVVPGTQAE
jgi:menaquinone-dependent protoporphyrinogen oxidase